MSSSQTRQKKFICSLIIQSIRVFENFDSSFYASWEFGKENGTTEYKLCNNDGFIELNKNYEFQYDPKSKSHKNLKIEVFRKAKKTKCIGKYKVDISNYLSGGDTLTQTVEMKPNIEEKPPEISFSFFSKLDIDTYGEQTEDDIQSIMEVTQELATISSRHKVSKSASYRRSVDLTPRLADMMLGSDHKSDEEKNKPNEQEQDDQLKKDKRKELRERRKTARSDSLKSISSFLSSSKPISRSSSTFTALMVEQAPIYDVIGDCLGNFDHLLSQKIEYTDKLCRSFEGPDSFIFAQCLADKLFDELDENSFQKIKEKVIDYVSFVFRFNV